MLDRAAVLALGGQSGYLGLRLVGLPATNTTLEGKTGKNPPVLVIHSGTPPVVPAVTVRDVSVTEGDGGGTVRCTSRCSCRSRPPCP